MNWASTDQNQAAGLFAQKAGSVTDLMPRRRRRLVLFRHCFEEIAGKNV
jgi:hypothetical protein